MPPFDTQSRLSQLFLLTPFLLLKSSLQVLFSIPQLLQIFSPLPLLPLISDILQTDVSVSQNELIALCWIAQQRALRLFPRISFFF